VEPLPVVHELAVLDRDLVLVVVQVALEAQLFERAVRLVQNGPAGSLVHPAALHAHETVLDERHLADAVSAANRVQRGDELVAGSRVACAVDSNGSARFELDVHVRRPVGCLADRAGDRVDAIERLPRRILDLAALVRDVPQVPILRVDLLLALRDRDLVPNRVVHRCFAIIQPVGEEARILPGRDDRERWIERHTGQLEPYLIVALPRRTVRDRVGPGLVGHVHLCLRDERTRDARAEQIVAFVGGMRAKHREAVLLRELTPQVAHHDVVGAAASRLALDALQLAALPELRRKRHHLRARISLLQPGEDDGRVEAAGVREHDLPGRRHGRVVYRNTLRLIVERLLFAVLPFRATTDTTNTTNTKDVRGVGDDAVLLRSRFTGGTRAHRNAGARTRKPETRKRTVPIRTSRPPKRRPTPERITSLFRRPHTAFRSQSASRYRRARAAGPRGRQWTPVHESAAGFVPHSRTRESTVLQRLASPAARRSSRPM
jgi:hypothetical protein